MRLPILYNGPMIRRVFGYRAVPVCASLSLALLLSVPFPADGRAAGREFRSASVCAQCHPKIHASWKSSQHSSAFTDPAFQLPYDRIRRKNPRRTLPCEQCHNPLRFHLPAGDPRASIFAQEGVTCDFCHSVESVVPGESFPRYRLNPDFKFGPYPPGKETGRSIHATRFSRLHITSAFCAGCHEYRNPYGVPILSTFSEWEESFYRGEGVHCQFCHLPQLFDPQFIDVKDRKGPVDHAMVGGHSRERMAKAIPLKGTLRISGGTAEVRIVLKNETVGHKTPSGIPMHRIRLVTSLFDESGTALGRKEELFERVVGDGAGNPLTKPEEIFTEAREVLKDNRIGPKETREVIHSFPLAGKRPVTAEVSLTYEIPTPDISPGTGSIDIPISRILIPAGRGISPLVLSLIALAVVAALLGTALAVRRKRP
ncbi:MAG: multiheme c-type cytochrome [Deltaproteobacteria bacterium]